MQYLHVVNWKIGAPNRISIGD